MGEDHVHVVFGTGQVGNALSAHLFSLGLPVRGGVETPTVHDGRGCRFGGLPM